jgi:iron complex transport system permease protein
MTARNTKTIAIVYVITIVIFCVSLFIGTYQIKLSTVIRMLLSKVAAVEKTWTQADETVLFDVRLPRVVLVILVGSALSVSGAVLQSIFRNPLVSPYLLGISSGASFGAALIVVVFSHFNPVMIQLSAFTFGMLAVLLASAIANLYGSRNNTIIILAGVIISALFTAMSAFLKYFADHHQLQTIVIWLMGNFSSARWQNVFQVAPFSIIGCILMILLSWRINVLSMGSQQAIALGINPRRFRIVLIAIVSLMTGIAVSACGPIGWIGLIVPHLVRMLVGSNNFHVIIGSIGMGAGFLLLVDLAARNILAVEIPIGILTSIVGAVFFIVFMIRAKKTIWQQ